MAFTMVAHEQLFKFPMFQVDWLNFYKDYPVTFLCLVANVGVFIGIKLGVVPIMVFEPSALTYHDLGSHFTHLDLMHLISNLIMLLFMGLFLERTVSSVNYLWIIGFCWLSVTSLLLVFDSGSSLGFSGIGLALIAFGFMYFRNISTVNQFLWPLLFINLFVGFLPGISFWGHFLGAVCGVAAYYIYTFAGGRD